MKIYGFFRGFPGLGRVMSGISVLAGLKELGHEVRGYSYLQGVQALRDHGIDTLMEKQPSQYEISAIGINPIGVTAADLIQKILDDRPDLVIVDGEALFISTLALVYPREKILALLNPADMYNAALPVSTTEFYHTHYLSAGSAIVHGIDKDSIILPENLRGCDVLRTNTILRQDVIRLSEKERQGTQVAAILGGGTSNASEGFTESTLAMARRIFDAARFLPEENFYLYCNDKMIADKAAGFSCPANVTIVSEYAPPAEIYEKARLVICRAGRNTISEILYLDIPAILMSASGEFRASEQEKNIDHACAHRPGRLFKSSPGDTGEQIAAKMKQAVRSDKSDFRFIPGNEEALEFIQRKLQTLHD